MQGRDACAGNKNWPPSPVVFRLPQTLLPTFNTVRTRWS